MRNKAGRGISNKIGERGYGMLNMPICKHNVPPLKK